MSPSAFIFSFTLALAACGPSGDPLPGYPRITWTSEIACVDEARMRSAFNLALDVLGDYSPWSRDRVMRDIAPCLVQVNAGFAIETVTGPVGGLAFETEGRVQVVQSLRSLAHELLHIVVYRNTGVIDLTDQHVGLGWERTDLIEQDFRARLPDLCWP